MQRKPLLAAVLVVGIAAVSFAGISLAAGGAKTATGTTIHLIEHDTSFSFVPIGPHVGDTVKAGDGVVFSGTLLTPQKKPTGRLNVSCVGTTTGKSSVLECTGTMRLAGGTLVANGLVTSPTRQRLAITGGTGAYEGARGSLVSVGNKSNPSISYDTVHLLP